MADVEGPRCRTSQARGSPMVGVGGEHRRSRARSRRASPCRGPARRAWRRGDRVGRDVGSNRVGRRGGRLRATRRRAKPQGRPSRAGVSRNEGRRVKGRPCRRRRTRRGTFSRRPRAPGARRRPRAAAGSSGGHGALKLAIVALQAPRTHRARRRRGAQRYTNRPPRGAAPLFRRASPAARPALLGRSASTHRECDATTASPSAPCAACASLLHRRHPRAMPPPAPPEPPPATADRASKPRHSGGPPRGPRARPPRFAIDAGRARSTETSAARSPGAARRDDHLTHARQRDGDSDGDGPWACPSDAPTTPVTTAAEATTPRRAAREAERRENRPHVVRGARATGPRRNSARLLSGSRTPRATSEPDARRERAVNEVERRERHAHRACNIRDLRAARAVGAAGRGLREGAREQCHHRRRDACGRRCLAPRARRDPHHRLARRACPRRQPREHPGVDRHPPPSARWPAGGAAPHERRRVETSVTLSASTPGVSSRKPLRLARRPRQRDAELGASSPRAPGTVRTSTITSEPARRMSPARSGWCSGSSTSTVPRPHALVLVAEHDHEAAGRRGPRMVTGIVAPLPATAVASTMRSGEQLGEVELVHPAAEHRPADAHRHGRAAVAVDAHLGGEAVGRASVHAWSPRPWRRARRG